MCLAIPGKLLSIAGDEPLLRTGRVSFGGVEREVSLAMVPEANIGDFVLVHVGVAISVVDEEEAARTFELLNEIEAAGESEEAQS
jgi:hydrogenase expression/formation protein HypC